MKRLAAIACLACLAAPALAGEFSIISMHHSQDHFVPHLRFDGPIEAGDADDLADLLDNMPRCAELCDGATAVLSLDSPGGSYVEALAMGALLRAARVATVVNADAACLSACLPVFAAGTARGPQGDRPDRIAVPGAQLMHYPLDQQHEKLAGRILSEGLETILGAPVKTLHALAVEKRLGLDFHLPYTAAQSYRPVPEDLSRPTDLTLLGATLPPAPWAQIMPDLQAGLLQACAHALTRFHADRHGGALDLIPWDASMSVDPAFQRDLGSIGGPGYRVRHAEVSFCVGHDLGAEDPGIWLFGPGEGGTEELFHMPIAPHMVFPVAEPTSALETLYRPFGKAWTFAHPGSLTIFPEEEDAGLRAELGIVRLLDTLGSRVSALGDWMIFEQVGEPTLGQGLTAYLKTPALIDQQVEGNRGVSLIRAAHAESGNAVLIAAVTRFGASWIGRIEADRPWSELSAMEKTLMQRWSCNFTAIREQLACP